MSRDEILTALKDGKLSVDDASALLAKNGGGAARRTIKRNKSGGLFVRDTSFEAFSEAKGKRYVASVNIPWEVASKLFTDGELLKEVVAFVQGETKAKKAG